MHAGVWDKSADGAHEVRGRTLGIVGYGNIGTQLSVLAENLGMRVLFYDTADRLALGNARRCATAAGPARRVRRRHAARRRPRRPTTNFFGEAEFARDEAGRAVPQPLARLRRRLRRAARAHRVRRTSPAPPSTCSRSSRRAAATSSSPSCAGCPTSSSPRTSAGRPRRRSRTSAGSSPASSATSSATASTSMSVNLPGLALPRAAGHAPADPHAPQRARACWPRSTACFAEHEVNVEAQLLGTRGELGYVVTDSASGTTAGDRRPDPRRCPRRSACASSSDAPVARCVAGVHARP